MLRQQICQKDPLYLRSVITMRRVIRAADIPADMNVAADHPAEATDLQNTAIADIDAETEEPILPAQPRRRRAIRAADIPANMNVAE